MTDTLNFDIRAVVGASKGNARAVDGSFALDVSNIVLAAALGASLTLKLVATVVLVGRSGRDRSARPLNSRRPVKGARRTPYLQKRTVSARW